MDTQISFPSPLRLSINLTDEQFWQLCLSNRDYRFERTAKGELIVMPPTGSDTGIPIGSKNVINN